jgi:ABC-2 type transport system permease protein
MMGPWRLEVLRAWRTRRLAVLAAAFFLFGLGDPILTHELPNLVKANTNGARITLPPQTAADGMAAFAHSVSQIGTLVVVIVTAASLAIDTRPGLSAFYRTRLRRPTRLILPRYLVITAASIAAFGLGTLGAWYESTVLLGHVPLAGLAGGFGLETLWLCFAAAVATACASAVRSVLGAAGWALACLLGLVALSNVTVISSWMPTRLASGAAALIVQPAPTALWHPVLTAAATAIALMWLALKRFGRREPYES